MQSVEQTFPLTPSLKLTVDQASFRRKASFLQFVQSGLELNFMVAIDFTGSNGDPTYPNSLHHCDPNAFAHGGMNEYERTIAMVGDVLEFYDTDRQYPVYGFGAQLPSGCVSHCFPLTGRRLGARSGRSRGNHEHLSSNADATCVFQVPLSLLQSFDAPASAFHTLLSHRIAQNIKPLRSQYLILLIITDGAIHDMDETVAAIVAACELPLSILIVGVGNDDFLACRWHWEGCFTQVLDGDERRLRAGGSRGLARYRSVRCAA